MHKIDDDLLLREEELHPDLRRYVCAGRWELGTFELHHPLVRTMRLDPQRAAIENRKYELASAKVREAMQSGEWSRYVFLHERPHRFVALRRIAGKIKSDKAYWSLLADFWMDSENIRQNRAGWIKLWNADRPGKHHTMSAKERKVLAQLPDVLPIYRGIGSAKGRNGLSWTLGREKAIFFARRFVGVSHLGGSSLLTARAL
jgi:hypothetical protein